MLVLTSTDVGIIVAIIEYVESVCKSYSVMWVLQSCSAMSDVEDFVKLYWLSIFFCFEFCMFVKVPYYVS